MTTASRPADVAGWLRARLAAGLLVALASSPAAVGCGGGNATPAAEATSGVGASPVDAEGQVTSTITANDADGPPSIECRPIAQTFSTGGGPSTSGPNAGVTLPAPPIPSVVPPPSSTPCVPTINAPGVGVRLPAGPYSYYHTAPEGTPPTKTEFVIVKDNERVGLVSADLITAPTGGPAKITLQQRARNDAAEHQGSGFHDIVVNGSTGEAFTVPANIPGTVNAVVLTDYEGTVRLRAEGADEAALVEFLNDVKWHDAFGV